MRQFGLGWICALVCAAQVRPATDQTQELQAAIDALPANGVLDCGNQRYAVTSLQLKPDMTLRNCQLEALAGTTDFVSPVTIDGRQQVKSNIAIYNVHVTGNRHGQSNIGYMHEEDGGRHCFRLLGRVVNVLIDGSSGDYCGTDGIALISYGVSTSDSPEQLPFQHITIRNSDFSFNRRQGASADGARDLTFENVTFFQNGTTIPGGTEGDHCAVTWEGKCYGTGFWYEDYRSSTGGEGLSGIVISNCVFRGNYQRSVYFYTIERPTSPGYQARSDIRILNSYLDAGSDPLEEDYALQVQVDDGVAGAAAPFQNILIQNSVLDGAVGFRHAMNVSFQSSQINTKIDYLGYSAYSTGIVFADVQGGGKGLAASYDLTGQGTPNVTYSTSGIRQSYGSSPPQSGSNSTGDIVWNTQSNGSPVGWICVTAGSPCSGWRSF